MCSVTTAEKRTARVPAEPIAKGTTDNSAILAAPHDCSKHRAVTLTTARGEQRVDSRALAASLGNKHRPLIALIDRYADEFRQFGQLLFQKAVGERKQGGGNPERFALLNEDQCYFLLALSRNTARVVALKARLVAAFQSARKAAEIRQTEYMPVYHQLHDTLHTLAGGAEHERFVHLNVNRLINKVAGVEAGTRPRADVPRQGLLIAAQVIAADALRGAEDHREGYERVKAALAPLQLARIGGRA
jgi:phage regulator Rha-like protein